jgi:hypothetical protein
MRASSPEFTGKPREKIREEGREQSLKLRRDSA